MRLVEVIASPENLEKLPAIVRDLEIKNFWPVGGKLDLAVYRILVEQEKSQALLDALQGILGPDGHIVLITPEAVLPQGRPLYFSRISPPCPPVENRRSEYVNYRCGSRAARGTLMNEMKVHFHCPRRPLEEFRCASSGLTVYEIWLKRPEPSSKSEEFL